MIYMIYMIYMIRDEEVHLSYDHIALDGWLLMFPCWWSYIVIPQKIDK